jgi:hypothetical protein
MKKKRFIRGKIPLLLGIVLVSAILITGNPIQNSQQTPVKVEGKMLSNIQVPPPPLSEDTFPCSMCHADMETNFERRELVDFHDDIVLKHDEENRWCLDCHDAENRDMLHTAGGQLLDFKESYMLCGQCHGPKLRDWEAGIHGRRTGDWNGQKQYLLCAHCHNPHTPRFPGMKPEPAPMKPGPLIKKQEKKK